MGMTERARSAFDEVIKAMGDKDSQLLKREPEIKKLVVDIVRTVEKAREPESWPVETYPDHYADIHPADHDRWVQLMIMAALRNEELASVLCYLRGTGCTLEPSKKYGYVIQPVIGDKGWTSRAEYDREKQPLAKHGELLMELLKKASDDE